MSMSTKPLWYRWTRVFFYGGSIIATGVILFKYTVPTDEELIARFSPEIRADYERNKLLRQEEQKELMKIVQKTAASDEPIWRTGPIKSPFEKEGKGVDPKLVDREQFHRAKGDDFKIAEIAKANLELEETNKLLRENKKRWWSWN